MWKRQDREIEVTGNNNRVRRDASVSRGTEVLGKVARFFHLTSLCSLDFISITCNRQCGHALLTAMRSIESALPVVLHLSQVRRENIALTT